MDILPRFRQLLAVVVFFGAVHGSSEVDDKELVITVPSGKVTRRVEDDLNLTCRVASKERYRITWVIPQDKVRQAHRIKIEEVHSNEKTVTIYHLEEPDSGWYTCVARHHDPSINRVFNRTVHVLVSAYTLTSRRPPCYNQSFVCGNGYCIPKRYACDGHVDCPDSSDEAPKHCGPDPCEDKVLCEDGRCLPRSLCCDPAMQQDCRVTYLLPCCKKYLASIANATVLVGVLAGAPHQRLGASVEYLQSSVYTVVSCAVVFILVATVMVAAICRIHMRRAVMASPFPFVSGRTDHRCLPWCRPLHHPVSAAGVGFGEGSPASCAHLAGADLRTVTCAHGSYVVATYSSSGTPGGRPKLHFLQQLPKPPEYSPLAQGPPPPYQSTEQLATNNKELHSGSAPSFMGSTAAAAAVRSPSAAATHPSWPCQLWPRDESPPPRFSSVQDLSECEAQCLLPVFDEAVGITGDHCSAEEVAFCSSPFYDVPAYSNKEEQGEASSRQAPCERPLITSRSGSDRLPTNSDAVSSDSTLSHHTPVLTRAKDSAFFDRPMAAGNASSGSTSQEAGCVERRAST